MQVTKPDNVFRGFTFLRAAQELDKTRPDVYEYLPNGDVRIGVDKYGLTVQAPNKEAAVAELIWRYVNEVMVPNANQ